MSITVHDDNPCDDLARDGWFHGGEPDIEVVSDATDEPLSAPSAIEWTFEVGFEGGSSPGYYGTSFTSSKTVSVDFSVWIPEGFQLNAGVQKLLHLYLDTEGGGNRAILVIWRTEEGPYYIGIGIQGITGTYAGGHNFNQDGDAGGGEITPGQWFKGRIVVVGNDEDIENGELHVYVQDGDFLVPLISVTDIEWDATPLLWNTINADPTWGGPGGVFIETEQTLRIGHIKVRVGDSAADIPTDGLEEEGEEGLSMIKNFAYSTVTVVPSPADSGTTLSVPSGHGARFAAGYPARIWPANSTDYAGARSELALVTGIDGDELTLEREYEDTTARTIRAGDQIAQDFTAGLYILLEGGKQESLLRFIPRSQWSAILDGTSTDDHTQACLDAIDAFPQGTLWLPRGVLNVESELLFQGISGLTWRGHGATATIIQAQNASPFILLRGKGIRFSQFSDFGIKSSAGTPLSKAIQIESLASTGVGTIQNAFRRINIEGTSGAGLDVGIATDPGDSSGNCSEFVLEDISFNNYATAGFQIAGSQSQGHVLHRCRFNGNGGGAFGVKQIDGSFTAWDCQGGGHTDADFKIQSPNEPIAIRGGIFANSNRFLRTTGGTSQQALLIEGVEVTVFAATINADGRLIFYDFRGPLRIQGCSFSGFDDPDDLVDFKIYLSHTGDVLVMGVTISDNHFLNAATDPIAGSNSAMRESVVQYSNIIKRTKTGDLERLETALMQLGGADVATV